MTTKRNQGRRTRAVKTYGASKKLRAPNPHVEEYSVIEHGRTRIVKYGWLTDPNYGKRLVNHVKAENQYASDRFRQLGIKKTAKKIAKELDGYFDTNRDEVVLEDGQWSYYTVLNETVTAASHWRFPTDGDKASQSQLIFDEVAEAKKFDADLFLGNIQISDDGELALVSYCLDGSEKYILQVRHISDGRVICECDGVSVDEMCGSVPHFNKSSDGVIFIRRDASEKDAYLCYREFSLTSKRGWVGREVRLYSEPSEGVSIAQTVSRDLAWIFLTRNLGDATDVLIFDRSNLRKAPVRFLKNKVKFNYGLDIVGNRAFVFTDFKQLPDGTLVSGGELQYYTLDISMGMRNANASLRAPINWELSLRVPEGIVVESYLLFSLYTVFECRVNGIPRVLVASRDEQGKHGSLFGIGNPDALVGQELYRSSDDVESNLFTVMEKGMRPTSIYRVSIQSLGEEGIEHTYDSIYTNLLNGFDTQRYSGRFIEAQASDGTMIPMMIWTPNHTQVVGSVLNVYGAYGHTSNFCYSESFRSLLENGVACAIAYVRGGGELGIQWHNAGRLGNKMNTITDTLAASRKIKELGLAGVDGKRIVLQGYSAGGVAVGGALNLSPESFAGVVGEVPFVDCLATMLDPRLPLTVVEYPEWGNPSKNKSEWDSIRSWSPVDNIPSDASHYPPVLATAGLGDVRVGVWEPARWVLTLRKAKAEVFLRTNISAGHAGDMDQSEDIKSQSEVIAFILWCLSRNN